MFGGDILFGFHITIFCCSFGIWISFVPYDSGIELRSSFVDLKSDSVCILDMPWLYSC